MINAIVLWDLDEDPEGNVQHIAKHEVTVDEAEEVLLNGRNPVTTSRSTGLPIVFGRTSAGRYLAVVFEHIEDDPLTLYPVTAYDVPAPR